MPRQKGQSQFYIITPMMNGMHRAECHKDDCHWWQDFHDGDEAQAAMKDHRKVHRKISAKKQGPVTEENRWLRKST